MYIATRQLVPSHRRLRNPAPAGMLMPLTGLLLATRLLLRVGALRLLPLVPPPPSGKKLPRDTAASSIIPCL